VPSENDAKRLLKAKMSAVGYRNEENENKSYEREM